MNNNEQAVKFATALLRESVTHIADARAFAPVGNSVAGSLLSIWYGIPRQYAEQAVLEALRVIDAEPKTEGEQTILTRTGKPPLRFKGELLEESDGARMNGKEQNRWHELAVYRTEGGKYVVRIAYRARWQGELDRDDAEIVAKPEQVASALQNYDPCGPVQGYPEGRGYEERQARLMSDIRRRYDAQVSELLASSPEFAEEIE